MALNQTTQQARRRLWIYQAAKQAGSRQSTAAHLSPAMPHTAAAQQRTHTLTDQRTGHGQNGETVTHAPCNRRGTHGYTYPNTAI